MMLQARFRAAVTSFDIAGAHPHVVIDAAAWHDAARYLRDDVGLGFNFLRCISAVDHIEDGVFTIIYDLHAIGRALPSSSDRSRPPMCSLRGEIAIKVRVPRSAPHIPTVSDIWPAANWHEREAFDLLGVRFDGHPNLKRILCCDDWVGHPLRKDYEFPLEYHGIPAVTEYKMTRPQH